MFDVNRNALGGEVPRPTAVTTSRGAEYEGPMNGHHNFFRWRLPAQSYLCRPADGLYSSLGVDMLDALLARG